MRILCLSAPLLGHLDWGGYLPTAVELGRRGHEVTWASGPAVHDVVRAAGLRFQALQETGWRWPPPPPLRPGELPSADFALARATRALDQWLDPGRVIEAVEELSVVVDHLAPQLIVSEMFILAAGLVAERFDLPYVVAGWPAHAAAQDARTGPMSPLAQDARHRLDTILAATGLKGTQVAHQGPPALLSTRLHIDYWSPGWYAGATLLPQTEHVGGSAQPPNPPDPTLPNPGDRPWVLITLGTTFGDDPAFFRMATEAALQLGCLPLLATGGAAHIGVDASREAVIRPRFDLPSVLPYTSAAIHHGGAGTTHALVLAGVPQIVVPHAGDQARQAQGVQRTGIGITKRPAEVRVDTLVRALAAILPDRAPTRAAATALRSEFAALGGIPRAADLIEGLLVKGADGLA